MSEPQRGERVVLTHALKPGSISVHLRGPSGTLCKGCHGTGQLQGRVSHVKSARASVPVVVASSGDCGFPQPLQRCRKSRRVKCRLQPLRNAGGKKMSLSANCKRSSPATAVSHAFQQLNCRKD